MLRDVLGDLDSFIGWLIVIKCTHLALADDSALYGGRAKTLSLETLETSNDLLSRVQDPFEISQHMIDHGF